MGPLIVLGHTSNGCLEGHPSYDTRLPDVHVNPYAPIYGHIWYDIFKTIS